MFVNEIFGTERVPELGSWPIAEAQRRSAPFCTAALVLVHTASVFALAALCGNFCLCAVSL